LAIAEAMKEANVTFKKEVVLAFFAGEEQGLLGSAAYASEWHLLPFCTLTLILRRIESLHEANATVLLQTQADMLGYHDVSPRALSVPMQCLMMSSCLSLWSRCSLHSPHQSVHPKRRTF
jgi:hypothetical protein